MPSDKPINAMYGSKMKLDLDKLKKYRKTEEVSETKSVKADSEKPVDVSKNVIDKEESSEEISDKVVEEVSEKPIDVSKDVVEDNIKEESSEEISKKPVEGSKEEVKKEKSSKKIDSSIVDNLKNILSYI